MPETIGPAAGLPCPNQIMSTIFLRSRARLIASRTRLCVNQQAIDSGDISKYCEKHRKGSDWQICPYYKKSDVVADFVLGNVTDIEEIAAYGRQCRGCPYYGVMKALEHANVVLAPYQYLLTVHILKNLSIVDESTAIVFDEAHNVTETILESNSYEKKTQKFERSIVSLTDIHRNFPENWSSLLGAEDEAEGLEKLTEEAAKLPADVQLAKSMLQSVLTFMRSTPLANVDSIAYPPIEFLRRCRLEIVALQQLVDRMTSYNWSVWRRCVLRQVDGETATMPHKETKRILSALRFIASFTTDPDDHVIVLKGASGTVAFIKKLLVNPVTYFQKLLNSSRCIVLTGGTMDPMTEYKRLFSSVLPSDLHVCDCEHVIPAENMQLFVLGKGLQGDDLKLTFDCKNSSEKLIAIGSIIEKLCEEVPNGIVCFFSSFDHIWKFMMVAKEHGIYERMQARKKVFEDKRSSSTTIFAAFETAAKTERGAILFTVVRGSLSEGINFKHEVGRCAVIVGQPYPNPTEAETREKMNFWDREGGEMKGRDYLTNLCFKAVNQCIGRVIRDQDDFAVVVLVDARYFFKSSMEKISSWAKRNYRGEDCHRAFESIRRFFEQRA